VRGGGKGGKRTEGDLFEIENKMSSREQVEKKKTKVTSGHSGCSYGMMQS
jgi:hypothetical protein